MKFLKSAPFQVFLVACVLLVGFQLVARALRPASAATPAFFDKSVTIPEALSASRESGKPALLFVTADWCGPCQGLKRGALADERVGAWIAANTHPVYVDATSDLPREAEGFNIEGFPTLLLVRDGREVSRIVGGVPTDELLGWLQSSSPR